MRSSRPRGGLSEPQQWTPEGWFFKDAAFSAQKSQPEEVVACGPAIPATRRLLFWESSGRRSPSGVHRASREVSLSPSGDRLLCLGL